MHFSGEAVAFLKRGNASAMLLEMYVRSDLKALLTVSAAHQCGFAVRQPESNTFTVHFFKNQRLCVAPAANRSPFFPRRTPTPSAGNWLEFERLEKNYKLNTI